MQRALMRPNLHGCEAVWNKLKNSLKCNLCFILTLRWTVSHPYRLSHINQPKDQSLKFLWNFLAVLKIPVFLDWQIWKKKKNRGFIHMKISKSFFPSKNGSKYWWLTWFQAQNNRCLKIFNTVYRDLCAKNMTHVNWKKILMKSSHKYFFFPSILRGSWYHQRI